MQRRSFLKLASAVAAPWPSGGDQNGDDRILTVDEQILVPNDGLLLGNGDLSAGVNEKPTSEPQMQRLRRGEYRPELDFRPFRENVERWRQPNGLLRAMSLARYSYAGAWTETLGIIAPLQEMMLQSWDGAIRLFPAWPKGVGAQFERFRAEGAFLVSASRKGGVVGDVEILSEKGAPCRIEPPWPEGVDVTESAGGKVALARDQHGGIGFETKAGVLYRVRRHGG